MKRPTEIAAAIVAAGISIAASFGVDVSPQVAAIATAAITIVVTFIVSRMQKAGSLAVGVRRRSQELSDEPG